MIGFGGIYVEILAETATRLGLVSPTPTPSVAREIPVDVLELEDIEIHPLIEDFNTVIAVDARARRGREE